MKQVALITGTSKGIGLHIARGLLSDGIIVVGCSRSKPSIEHKDYFHFICDITNEKASVKMIKDVFVKFNKIDILVNNAGAASLNHAILTPSATLDRIFALNFRAAFVFSREVAKKMMKNRYGRIINFSTVAVPLNLEGEMIYSSSKAAVEQMTKVLSKELGKFGITVNAIGPSPVKTDLIKAVPKAKINELIDLQSIPRLSEFGDILNVIKFYINKNSDFVTGQIIYLGGIS